MRVAIIAPTRHLSLLATTNYHLILAHKVLECQEYADFYRERSQQGDYVILDNSAHELGTGLPPEQLAAAASIVQASELVLPDRLFFGEDTVERSNQCFDSVRQGINFMAVPQGRTLSEWLFCLNELLHLTTTIGISKDYEVWEGGLATLVRLSLSHGATSIHLLGWGRDLGQLLLLQEFTQIRGVDSAKPIVFASSGVALPDPELFRARTTRIYYPKRGEGDYFDTVLDRKQMSLAQHNISIFRKLAGDPTLSRVLFTE